MHKILALAGCSLVALSACGSGSKSSSASANAPTAAFCADVRSVGSLSKSTQDAMAMSPAESSKDFAALAGKVSALTAHAPGDLVPTITTVAARYTLEAKAEGMMATNANGATEETQMLADHKAADDAAFAQLVAGARSRCNADIS